MEEQKLSEAGQFNFEVVNLITSEGNLTPVTDLTQQIEIYEDIQSNSITGYIFLQDTMGLTNIGPI